MRTTTCVFLLCLLVAGCAKQPAAKPTPPKAAHSIPELRQQLEQILKDGHTPGMSIAIVHRDAPEWVDGVGESDVITHKAVDHHTLFRIGSTSKAFASLSVLKLVGEGKLSLQDPVHKLAPEVWFENPWEASDPVRVVDLLEHTTGWDDLHLREYAYQVPNLPLRDGLDYDHHSRTSRWPPGTRMSYSNSGPPVAAFIVQKISGQTFEDYVEQNFFQPIGMKTATYFEPPPGTLTTLYADDGKTALPFWHIIERPAGSISASADDMAAYLQFYLNRGTVNGTEVMPASAIDRMERATRAWAAQQGVPYGYGLSNYVSVYDGFVYHGHNGGVGGDLTDLAYLPDYGVGYFFSLNTAKSEVFTKVGKAVRAYLTSTLTRPAVAPAVPLPAGASAYAGWYVPDSSRQEFVRFLDLLLGISRVSFDAKGLTMGSLDGAQHYVPVAGAAFRRVPADQAPDPLGRVVLIAPNAEGQFIQLAGGGATLKRIPGWRAWLQIALSVAFLLVLVSVLLYAPFWALGGLIKRRRRPAERAMRLWPLIAVISLLGCFGILSSAGADTLQRLGDLTAWSLSVCLTSWLFALSSVAAAIALWRAPKEGVRRWVRRFSIYVTAILLLTTLYLAYWGFIGLRTWA